MLSLFKKYPDNRTLGPLLITIGPNCSGKTEFVKSLGEDVKEFSNDNIHGLYERIPIGLAAAVWSDKITGDVIQALKNQKSTGKPLMERLKEQKESELVYLTLYYARLMTLEELTSKLKKILPTAEYFDAFMEVIVDIKLMMKSKTIDVFIPEAVESGVVGVVTAVKAAIKTEPGVICWGNNNVEPVFYKEILNTCRKYKRVVRFVRWGHELPSCSLKELFKRSILQLLRTGRYVESFEIAKNWAKAELFFKQCHSGSHADIARVSGYFMDINGTLNPLKEERNPKKTVFTPTKWSEWTNVGNVFNLKGKPVNQTSNKSSGVAAASDLASSAAGESRGVSPTHSVSVDSEMTTGSKNSAKHAALKPTALLASTAEGESGEEEETGDGSKDGDFNDFRMLSVSLPPSSDVNDGEGRGGARGMAPLEKDSSQASALMWNSFYESKAIENNAAAAGTATTITGRSPSAKVSFYDEKPAIPTEPAASEQPAVSSPLFDYFAFKESIASETPKVVEEKKALPSASTDEDCISSTQVQASDGGWCVLPDFKTLFAF